MQIARLDELQTGIKIAGRNNNLRYVDDTTLMAKSKENIKSLLMRVKKESENGLETNHWKGKQKQKLISWHPVSSSWQIEWEKWK